MTPLVKAAVAVVCVIIVITALVVFVGGGYIFGSAGTRTNTGSPTSSLPLCVMVLSHWTVQYIPPSDYSVYGNSTGYFAFLVASGATLPFPTGSYIIQNVDSYTGISPGQTWLAVNESAYAAEQPQPSQLASGCQSQALSPIVYWVRALSSQNMTTETTTTISVGNSTTSSV